MPRSEEQKQKYREAALRRFLDPEERLKQSKRLKKTYKLPQLTEEQRLAKNAKIREATIKRYEDPAERQRASETNKASKTPESIAKQVANTDYVAYGEKMKAWHADSANKEKHRQAMKDANLPALWTAERRATRAEEQRRLWASRPELVALCTELRREWWRLHPERRQELSDRLVSYSSLFKPWSRRTEYAGITFHSTWEAAFARRCDTLGVLWEHHPGSFPYNWEGRQHLYYPDFYLSEFDFFVEIKGFCSERDFAKFDQFPHALLVLFSLEEVEAWQPTYNFSQELA